jgi:hypothetical protein
MGSLAATCAAGGRGRVTAFVICAGEEKLQMHLATHPYSFGGCEGWREPLIHKPDHRYQNEGVGLPLFHDFLVSVQVIPPHIEACVASPQVSP